MLELQLQLQILNSTHLQFLVFAVLTLVTTPSTTPETKTLQAQKKGKLKLLVHLTDSYPDVVAEWLEHLLCKLQRQQSCSDPGSNSAQDL